MTKDNIPKTVSEGKIKLGDLTLNVYVLEDGRRVIDQESIEKFIEYLSNPNAKQATEKELKELGKFIHGGKID